MAEIDKLIEIMAALRHPETGCPWDVEQDFASIAPYTVEEAYEVADAIERGNISDLREELGDLLLQVVFHSRMAEEGGHFAFADVAAGINEKLVRRHPHVFGDAEIGSAEEQHKAWEALKAEEKAAKGQAEQGLLAGLTTGLPALTLAYKTGKKAASVGFDWNHPGEVVDKIHEELDELAEADAAGDADAIEDELGDLLLAVTNLARQLDIDPEQALRRANRKFTNRFKRLEALIEGSGEDWTALSGDELEERWQRIKQPDD